MSYTPKVGDTVRVSAYPEWGDCVLLGVDNDETWLRLPDGDHAMATAHTLVQVDEAIDQRHIHDGGPRATRYTPKVGDRVRRPDWDDRGWWIDVEYVGRTLFVGTAEDGVEFIAGFQDDWVKVEPRPKIAREQWGWIAAWRSVLDSADEC